MKFILSGGWNNKSEDSIKKCFLYTYKDQILQDFENGKKIAFVNLAKPAKYYDALIYSIYEDKIEIIEDDIKSVEWSEYDGLYFLGGTAMTLKNNLLSLGFSLDNIKPTAKILGDSAGAYAMSSYFYDSPPGEKRGVEINFIAGFNNIYNVITIAHKNNPFYCNDILITKVNTFAKENNLRVIMLNENEQVDL
ncbi:MAG: hypothetical protein U0525_03120 [Patescibacteria group bacterium]